MADVPVLVLRAAGINCDEEVMHCWRLAGARPTLMHINRVAETPAILDDFTVVTSPGGFSYGDDIAAGTILAQRVLLDLMEPLRKLVDRGGGLLGICNGFQVLVKMGVLPGGRMGRSKISLAPNTSARFEDRWVRLRVCTDHCAFLQRSRFIEAPVAHAEGRLVVEAEETLAALGDGRHGALRYVDHQGRIGGYPVNPNGSVDALAGLTDDTGRVLGLMPHPERHVDRTQHPLWTRRPEDVDATGLDVFRSAVDSLT